MENLNKFAISLFSPASLPPLTCQLDFSQFPVGLIIPCQQLRQRQVNVGQMYTVLFLDKNLCKLCSSSWKFVDK